MYLDQLSVFCMLSCISSNELHIYCTIPFIDTGMSSLMILSAECSQIDITDVTAGPSINESIGSRQSSGHAGHKSFDTSARNCVYNNSHGDDVHNTNARIDIYNTNARPGVYNIQSTDEYIDSENVNVKYLAEPKLEVCDKQLYTEAPPLSKCLTSGRYSVKTVGNSTILDYECDPSVNELDIYGGTLEDISDNCGASRTCEQKLQTDCEEVECDVIEQQNDVQHFGATCDQDEKKCIVMYHSNSTVLSANHTDTAVRSSEDITHDYHGNEERKTSDDLEANGEIQLLAEMQGQKVETVMTENRYTCKHDKALSDSCNETGSALTKEENVNILDLDQHILTLNKTGDRTMHNENQNKRKLENHFRCSENEESKNETAVYYSDSGNDETIVSDSDKEQIKDDDRTDSKSMRGREEDDYPDISEDDPNEDKGSEFENDGEVEAIIAERNKGYDVFDIHDSDEVLDDVLELFASDEEASFLDIPK